MNFPKLYARPRSQLTTDVFAGYNHNARISENEFYDMRNLSSDMAPVISQRKNRGLYAENVNVQGMIAKNSLCYVNGTAFVINGHPIEMGLSTAAEDCPKQLISMGAYVIIMPDKKYINTADLTDYGAIEAETTTGSAVTFTPCRADGTEYKADYIQASEPSAPKTLALWVDTSTQPHSLKQYSKGTNMWVGVETTYVKISSAGIGKAFREYDGVTINGLKGKELTSETGEALDDRSQLEAIEGAAIVYACGDDYLCVIGILDAAVTISNAVTVARKMPAMDFVIENENRLWGCRYGLNNDGEVVNELYASKLGDFRNWNCFMGISTDSYAVSLGSDGPFTGAIAHAGHPLFWKENYLHNVFGQIPANFSVQTTTCRGVQKGSARSLAIVNEILYYKAQHAICAYDGSIPVEVSAALGEDRYVAAVAAAYGNKYYISMQHAVTGKNSLFVYDTAKGMWHKEDDLRAYLLCPCREELYCGTEDQKIITMLGSGEAYEHTVPWMCETGIIGGSNPEKKYLVKLNIRIISEPGARFWFYADYDSAGQWQALGTVADSFRRSFTITLLPIHCDHLRLRIEGTGKSMIHSITKTYAYGSDVS